MRSRVKDLSPTLPVHRCKSWAVFFACVRSTHRVFSDIQVRGLFHQRQLCFCCRAASVHFSWFSISQMKMEFFSQLWIPAHSIIHIPPRPLSMLPRGYSITALPSATYQLLQLIVWLCNLPSPCHHCNTDIATDRDVLTSLPKWSHNLNRWGFMSDCSFFTLRQL